MPLESPKGFVVPSVSLKVITASDKGVSYDSDSIMLVYCDVLPLQNSIVFGLYFTLSNIQ